MSILLRIQVKALRDVASALMHEAPAVALKASALARELELKIQRLERIQ